MSSGRSGRCLTGSGMHDRLAIYRPHGGFSTSRPEPVSDRSGRLDPIAIRREFQLYPAVRRKRLGNGGKL